VKARVLLVDDHEDNLVLARDLLLDEGFEVLEARDGTQAMKMALAHRPDLILLDMRLPGGVSGWEVARILRGSVECRSTLIVALTAHAMPGDRERILEAGCHEVITKPISVATFIDALTRMLEAHRA
jgi:CheY-like chemotaxis protein